MKNPSRLTLGRRSKLLLAGALGAVVIVILIVSIVLWRRSSDGSREFSPAELRELLKPVEPGKKVTDRWVLRSIRREGKGAIVIELDPRSSGIGLMLRLTRRNAKKGAFCRSPSFNIVYLISGGHGHTSTPRHIHEATQEICRLVQANDRGQIKLGVYVPTGSGPSRTARFDWQQPVFLALFFLIFALAVFFQLVQPMRRLLASAEGFVERNPWPWLGLILAGMAVLRLYRLDIPFDADYMTQRVFFASLDLDQILAHHYADQRHPQLFYLILHFFLWLGHDERIVRLPAVVFSLCAVGAFFVMARTYLGAVRSLVACLLLALSTAFLFHSRDVSDLTLFIFLSILSTHLFLRSLRDPAPRRLILLVLAETAMLYSYYLAILVSFIHLSMLLVFGRWRTHRHLFYAAGAALLLALPMLLDFGGLVLADVQTRQVAHQFPGHVWGEKTSSSFLIRWVGLVTPPGEAAFLLFAFLAAGVVRWASKGWKSPSLFTFVLLIVLPVAVIGHAVAHVRLMEYYLLFVLPPFLMLVVAGAMGPGPAESEQQEEPETADGRRDPGWRRYAVSGLAAASLTLLLFVALSLANTLYYHFPSFVEAKGRDHFAKMGAVIKAHFRAGTGPRQVVADPDCLHTILIYYAFPEPLRMYRTCRCIGQQPIRCEYKKRRLFTLTPMARMKPGFEELALRRLEGMRTEPLWFVSFEGFKNEPLMNAVKARCALKGVYGRFRLFLCPARKST